MNSFKLYSIAALGGILFSLAFPPVPFNFLAFIFLIPILFTLEQKPTHWFRLAFTFSFFLNLGTLWWVGSWQKNTDQFLMISGIAIILFHPFFYFILFYLYKYFRKKYSLNTALLIFPLIWTFYDWFTTKTDFAFPWLALGYTQTNNFYWNQIADIGGVWLIGLIILYINVIIFKLIILFQNCNYHFKSFINNKLSKVNIIVVLLLLLLPFLYSLIKINQYDNISNDNNINIAIIQPNIDPWHKWASSTYDNINRHIRIQDSLLITNRKFDLAIWPETSITYSDPVMNAKPYEIPILKNWINRNEISVLTGFSEIFFYNSKEIAPVTARRFGNSLKFYQSFNSALLISPEKFLDTVQIYRKMILTPFSERIPYVEVFSYAKDLISWSVGISNWGLGWDQSNMNFHQKNKRNIKIASIICIESTQPNFVRKFANSGAEIFSIITNDAWFKYTVGPHQHFAIAQMRAIENKRFIARCSNSGVSGFIHPTGKIIKKAEQYKDQGIIENIPALNDLTFYSFSGDFIPYLAILTLLYFFIISFIKRKEKK